MERNTFDAMKLFFKLAPRYFFYMKSQYWDEERFNAYQNEQLIKVVRHAQLHVPYYRNLFAKTGFDALKFSGSNDMHKIPLLDKETLRKQNDEFVASDASKYGIFWEQTSGSTGTPLNLLLDSESRANKFAAVLRAYNWSGYKFGDYIFSIRDLSPDDDTIYRIDRLTRRIYFYSNLITSVNCLKINAILNQYKPSIYLGFGNSFLILGRVLKQNKIKIHSPKAIINFGENLSQSTITQLESDFQSKVFDFYSHTENAVLIHQCDHGSKHFAPDYAFHEVVDKDGHVIEEGTGELVGTSFYNNGMPLLRYKTRDNVTISNEPCKCGRKSKLVDCIVGRMDDYIITPEGRYLFIPNGAIYCATGLVTSQYVQDAIDHVTVNLVIDNSFQMSVMPEIESGLRARFGHTMKIDIKIVDSLELTKAGKAPFIISKIGNRFDTL